MTAIYGAVFIPAFIAIFAEAPFSSAKVCAPSGFANVGLLIGHTTDGVYLGERQPPPSIEVPDFDPRITVIPTAEVGSLFVTLRTAVAQTATAGLPCASCLRMLVPALSVNRRDRRGTPQSWRPGPTPRLPPSQRFETLDRPRKQPVRRRSGRHSSCSLSLGRSPSRSPTPGDTATSAGQRATRAARQSRELQRGARTRRPGSRGSAASAAADAYRRLRDAVREALQEAVADSG